MPTKIPLRGRMLTLNPEMKFLDINLTKDSSLLLHAIHSLSTGLFLKKTRLYSGFKNTYKNPQNKKTLVYSIL
jgi:hypothetical protein